VVGRDSRRSHTHIWWFLHLRLSDQDLEACQIETSWSRPGLFYHSVASVVGLVTEAVGRRLPSLDSVEL
jgi:hypothetical protein